MSNQMVMMFWCMQLNCTNLMSWLCPKCAARFFTCAVHAAHHLSQHEASQDLGLGPGCPGIMPEERHGRH